MKRQSECSTRCQALSDLVLFQGAHGAHSRGADPDPSTWEAADFLYRLLDYCSAGINTTDHCLGTDDNRSGRLCMNAGSQCLSRLGTPDTVRVFNVHIMSKCVSQDCMLQSHTVRSVSHYGPFYSFSNLSPSFVIQRGFHSTSDNCLPFNRNNIHIAQRPDIQDLCRNRLRGTDCTDCAEHRRCSCLRAALQQHSPM